MSEVKEYHPITFVGGPFKGLLGRAIKKSGEEKWYVEVNIAGRPVMQEVPAADISPLQK